jgi:hypothetical protein
MDTWHLCTTALTNDDVNTVSVVITEVLGFWGAAPASLLWDIKRGSR